jgi:hypothetical protein
MKKIDFISQGIDFNFNSSKGHTSTFGGVISILVILASLALSAYFSTELFEKKQPKAYMVSKFEDDAGTHIFDSHRLFHMAGIINRTTSEALPYNPRLVQYYGRSSNGDEWEYETCNYEIDLQGLNAIVDKKSIANYVCARKYYSPSKNISQIKNSVDAAFTYPFIAYGMSSSKKAIRYNFFGDACVNTTLNNNMCLPQEQVNEYFFGKVYQFKFIDRYFDVSNYNHPEIKYLNNIAGIISFDTMVQNNLNFNAVNMKTHTGFLLDEIEEFISLKFDFNEKISNRRGIGDANFFEIAFYLQNLPFFYERFYIKIHDVLASVGGVVQALSIIGSILNSLANKFQILKNMEEFIEKQNIIINFKNVNEKRYKSQGPKEIVHNKQNNSVLEKNFLHSRDNVINDLSFNTNMKSTSKIYPVWINLAKLSNRTNNDSCNKTSFKKSNWNNLYGAKLTMSNFLCSILQFQKKAKWKLLENLRIEFLNEVVFFKMHVDLCLVKRRLKELGFSFDNDTIQVEEFLGQINS